MGRLLPSLLQVINPRLEHQDFNSFGRGGGGRGALSCLNVVVNFHSIDPLFPFKVRILCLTRLFLPLFLQKKNQVLSITLILVLEIIGPKAGLIFHPNLSFDSFEAFSTKFLLDFPSTWSTFSLSIRSFWPLILDPFFSSHTGPLPILPKYGEVPPIRSHSLSRLYGN